MISSIILHSDVEAPAALVPVADSSGAASDVQLIGLWLAGRPAHTARAYQRDAQRFLAAVAKALREVTLADVAAFVEALDGAASSRARTISAIKSLLSFAHRAGYLAFNVGTCIKAPKAKSTLAERIMPEAQVARLIGSEPCERNRTLLTVLYASGGRVSEVCGLRVRDLQARASGGQVTLFGKGGKTRAVLLPASAWAALAALAEGQGPDAPVFRSRKGGALGTSAVWRIVAASGARIGVDGVSPHWFRHAHASHALDRGAPAHLVQTTLGHASLSTTSRYAHARPNDSSARYLAV